jgi:hypothetical protein
MHAVQDQNHTETAMTCELTEFRRRLARGVTSGLQARSCEIGGIALPLAAAAI